MRRQKSREINIFSMSALDLFASALGAFILITVVALPYYLNTDTHHEDYKYQTPGDISSQNKFFIVTMYWVTSEKQDIDLIVVDPQGRKYNYKNKKYAGSTAKLVFDAIGVIKGTEMWTDENVNVSRSGKWEIYFSNYKATRNVKVEGSLYTNNGSFNFPVHRLGANETKHVATIKIDTMGNDQYQFNVIRY